MKTIRIVSESAAVGKRLRDILYQDGYPEITLSDISAMPESRQDDILIIYAKTHISDLMQQTAACSGRVLLLLNPDCYAMFLERARYAGITPLLMPVAPFVLLDAVRRAIS